MPSASRYANRRKRRGISSRSEAGGRDSLIDEAEDCGTRISNESTRIFTNLMHAIAISIPEILQKRPRRGDSAKFPRRFFLNSFAQPSRHRAFVVSCVARFA